MCKITWKHYKTERSEGRHTANPGWKDLINKWKLFKGNLYWNYLILILKIPKELWGWGIGLITKIIRKHKLMRIGKNMVKSEK